MVCSKESDTQMHKVALQGYDDSSIYSRVGVTGRTLIPQMDVIQTLRLFMQNLPQLTCRSESAHGCNLANERHSCVEKNLSNHINSYSAALSPSSPDISTSYWLQHATLFGTLIG